MHRGVDRQHPGLSGRTFPDRPHPSVAPYAARFVTVTPDNPRALSAGELKTYLSQFGKPVTACETVKEGVAEAIRQAGPDGVVLAYGSLYMVGDIRASAAQLEGEA